MNCTHVQEQLLLADSGELTAHARVRVDRHLAGCAACRAYATALQAELPAIRTALRSEALPPLPAATRDTILAAARPDRRNILVFQPTHRPVAWWRPALALAALFAVLLAAWGLFRTPPQDAAPAVAAVEEAPAEHLAWDDGVDTALAELDTLWTAMSGEGDTQDAASMDEEQLAREWLALEGITI